VTGLFVTVARVMRSIIADLTPAPGRQDHTTSPYAGLRIVARSLASTAACPGVSDDGRRPLLSGQDGHDMPRIRIAEKQNIFLAGSGRATQITFRDRDRPGPGLLAAFSRP
jgi:hypothetical protein